VRRDLPFDEIADAVNLSSPAFAEKDYYVIQALNSVNTVSSDHFTIAFAGGTSLTKAHGLTERMSEDIDIKILQTDKSLTGNSLRRTLRAFRSSLCDALLETGFEFDPTDRSQVSVSREGKFFRINLEYTPKFEEEYQLRPHIQIEMDLRTPKIDPIGLPVQSFAAHVMGESPEITNIPCVTVNETASEKLVALLWRIFSQSVGEGPEYNEEDERLVRHLYDLCMMESKIDVEEVGRLAKEVAKIDAIERANQAPSFAKDPPSSLNAAVNLLIERKQYASQYLEFMDAMVYGKQRPSFEQAHTFVSRLADESWGGG
jgi:predicted nucleotidyltransferase component of viral defense system